MQVFTAILRRVWPVYVVALLLGYMSLVFFVGPVGKLIEALLLFGLAVMFLMNTSDLASLHLPVGRWRLAIPIWILAVVGTGVAYGLGQYPMMRAAMRFEDAGFSAKRELLVFGIMASISLALAMFRRSRIDRNRYAEIGIWAVRGLPFLPALASAYGFISMMRMEAITPAVLHNGVSAAMLLVLVSLIFAVPAWYPRRIKIGQKQRQRTLPSPADFRSLPHSPQQACLRYFWGPFAGVGLAAWTFTLVILIALNLGFGEPISLAHDNAGYDALIPSMGVLTPLVILPFLPNARALRFLPLSRLRLNLLILSLMVFAHLPVLAIVVVSVFAFSWSVLETIALVAYFIAQGMLLTVIGLVVNRNSMFSWVHLPGFLIFSMSSLGYVPVRPLYLCAAAMSVLAYAMGYYVIGRSVRAYRQGFPVTGEAGGT